MRALPSLIALLVIATVAGCGDGGSQATSSNGGAGGSGASSTGGGGAATTSAGGASTTSAGGGGTGGSAGGAGGGTGGSTATTGTGGGTGSACMWGDDCGTGFYCFAPGCGAGNCKQKPIPAGLSPDLVPVCGCDGITYWNDDVAASRGMSIETTGECASPMACSPMMPCPGTAKCSREAASAASCDPSLTGQCWGLPISCPLDGPQGRACSNGLCELQCSLIQSQNPWYEDSTCN